MTLSNFLGRIAVVPLAYVTLLGACNGIGVTESPEEGLPFIPNAAGVAIEAEGLQPVLPIRTRSQLELGERFDRQFDTINFDRVFIDGLADWKEVPPASEGEPDAGTHVPLPVEDAGTPLACTGGQVACFAACVDLQTDNANCGGCGIACGDAETCQQGLCTAGCDE